MVADLGCDVAVAAEGGSDMADVEAMRMPSLLGPYGRSRRVMMAHPSIGGVGPVHIS